VRAYIPKQEIDGATVNIQIVEAKYGATRIEGETTRTSEGRLKRMVERQQKTAAPLNADAVDRSLLLINDLPGVSATGRLAVGVSQAETDLVLDVIDGPLVNGGLTLDNAGSRFTGEARIVANASLNSRLGIGDRADALLLHSEGNDYVSLAYSLPVGVAGWRVGANASHLDYDIITREFRALDAHGASNTIGLESSYPILRSRLTNLYFTLSADDNRFENMSGGVTTTDYEVRSATAGVYGNRYDKFMGGGASTASVLLTQGDVNLSGSPNQLADSLTTRTDGSFRKVNMTLSRLQVINGSLSLFGSVTGQAASKNLDSSEKIYLGGSQGVRAYPEDEAGGSEGMVANLEARTPITQSITLTSFVDWGRVRVNKDNEIAGAVPENSLTLKGAGVSVGWAASFGLNVKGTYARRIGDNPNPTSNGDDQDGTLKKNRVWLQASMSF
jgi:hemolysin activation/secretion protein